jgi:hypothetical protein
MALTISFFFFFFPSDCHLNNYLMQYVKSVTIFLWRFSSLYNVFIRNDFELDRGFNQIELKEFLNILSSNLIY